MPKTRDKSFGGGKGTGAGSSRHFGVAKKGVGSFSKLTTSRDLGRLKLGWYCNRRPRSTLREPQGAGFVPMFWSTFDLTAKNLAAVAKSKATHVLGFNEPDMASQANMSPEECLEHWPRLEALPQRLGSPAPAAAKWLDEFM